VLSSNDAITPETFSAVIFAHPIAQVFLILKHRGCGFESDRRRYILFF